MSSRSRNNTNFALHHNPPQSCSHESVVLCLAPGRKQGSDLVCSHLPWLRKLGSTFTVLDEAATDVPTRPQERKTGVNLRHGTTTLPVERSPKKAEKTKKTRRVRTRMRTGRGRGSYEPRASTKPFFIPHKSSHSSSLTSRRERNHHKSERKATTQPSP